jgi:integrase
MDYIDSTGKRVRESAKTADRETAQRILDDRRGRVARGEVVLPRADKVTFDEARQDLLDHYRAHQTRRVDALNYLLAHLDKFFAGKKLTAIRPDVVTRYVLLRHEDGAAAGSIRNEIDLLTRLLNVAVENGKLERVPKFQKPKAAPARAGFVTDRQFEAIRAHLPEELKTAVTVAYTFGWRKREFLGLKKHQYDPIAGTLRLEPGTTKNQDGRLVRVTAELAAMLDAQVTRVREMELKLGRVVPWLFPHLPPHPLAGERIVDPRKAWKAACRAAGVPGILLHDLRRSAVRNLEAAGVPRSVAMKLTGHRTESVYRRYAIVSDADLHEATARIEAGAARRRGLTHSVAHSGPAVENLSHIFASQK